MQSAVVFWCSLVQLVGWLVGVWCSWLVGERLLDLWKCFHRIYGSVCFQWIRPWNFRNVFSWLVMGTLVFLLNWILVVFTVQCFRPTTYNLKNLTYLHLQICILQWKMLQNEGYILQRKIRKIYLSIQKWGKYFESDWLGSFLWKISWTYCNRKYCKMRGISCNGKIGQYFF